MRLRTVILWCLEVFSTPGRSEVVRRTQIKLGEACARHEAFSWFATVFVLGFLCMACRNPDEVAHKPADQDTRHQVANPAKDAEIRLVPGEKLAGQSVLAPHPTSAEMNTPKAAVKPPMDQVGKRGKGQVAPGTAGEKEAVLIPPTQAANTAKGLDELRATEKIPADQTAMAPMAVSATDRGETVVAEKKDVTTLAPPTQEANTSKGLKVLRSTTENPTDQATLAQVARRDKDWSVRKAAVEGLTSQAVLAQIATTDEDLDIRKLAVSRLTVQAALVKVATGDKDWSVRKTATAMLTEQGDLARIALTDEDSDIRKLAVSMLTDQTALARVVRSDKDWTVRRSAVNQLTDPAVLALVATSDQDPDIRKLAVSKLRDQGETP
jgi:hypothetical protein